ncbi:MAG TPA: DUF58 domain-containing protein [Streptosporangiaceae bacterium]|jgi:uncharacterized protein (DUF58 family)
MLRTLTALTTRGRSFAAAGVTAIICSFVLGERDLLRAGVLVLALPLLSALAVSRTRYRLACARRLDPSRLPIGHEAHVDLRLENVSRLPTGLLLVSDRVPYTLGGLSGTSGARFVLDRVEPQGARELSYRVRSDVRGRFKVGPLSVRLADPFGLVELARSFSMTDTLTVTPTIVPLPRGRFVGAWTGGGDSRARTISTAGEDDVAPREYRHGDDLRRVHWRSTARYGELMVRREEQQWQSRGTLFLDTRRSVHPGEGPASSFEQAVSAAASIGVHLGREGFGLRFVTDAGEVLGPSSAFHGALLDSLAVVRTSRNHSLQPGLAALRGAVGSGGEGDGLVIAVLGRLSQAEARALSGIRRGTATCMAVLIDIDTPAGETSSGAAAFAASTATSARLLRAAGWRVVTVSSAAALATAWAHADQAAEDIQLTAVRDRSR